MPYFPGLSNVTVHTESRPLHYRSNGNIKRSFNSVSLNFRTRQSSATLLNAQRGSDYLTVSLIDSQPVVELQTNDKNVSIVHSMGRVSDGKWHTLELKWENHTLLTSLWILALDGNQMKIESTRVNGFSLDFLREEADIFLGGLDQAAGMSLSGCLGPAEVGGLHLPFHMDTELNFPRPQAEQFVRIDGVAATLRYGCWGASVCEPNPCENDGVCEDVFDLHQCTCSSEWTGLLCQDPTDSCLSSPCIFGNCTSLPGEYKCDCEPGYGGDQCELEIDMCENSNCSSGATCLKGFESYACLCPQNLTGQYCE